MVLVVAAVVIRLGAKGAFKLAKVLRNPKVQKGIKVAVKFVKGGPRRKAFSIEKEKLRGPSPVADTLAVIVFEKITRPVFATLRFDLPSTKQAADDLVDAFERGDFEIETRTIVAGLVGGVAIRDQILFEASRSDETPEALKVSFKVLLFLL